jgi:hypothetical protein
MSDDTNLNITYTQVGSCALGKGTVEVRRQSLRAKLEREREERQQRIRNSFTASLRNLFSSAGS